MTTPVRSATVRAVVALSTTAGIVDAVSFLGLGHVFTSNMTGNLASVAFAATAHPGLSVRGPASSLSGFVLGALIAGRAQRRVGPVAILGTSATALAVVVALLAFARSTAPAPLLLGLLGTAMGMQAVAVRPLRVSDVSTVVITSTLMGLLADSQAAPTPPTPQRRRAAAVLCFAVGAVTGALLSRASLALALTPALIVDGMALAVLTRSGRHADDAHDPALADDPVIAAEQAARAVAEEYVRAFNAEDLDATRAIFHYPSVRLVAGQVRLTCSPDQVTLAYDALRREGWVLTRLDQLTTVHARPDKVHLAARFSRLNKQGASYATYDALWIITRCAGRWALQGRSTFAPEARTTTALD